MIKKGLLFILMFFITSCAGTIRIAEEDKTGSTIPTKSIMVKPIIK